MLRAAGRRFRRTTSSLHQGRLPAEPPIEGRDLPGVVTSTGAMDIDTVPARLVVIGGGVIGLEFACIYEALGSQVTVLEMAPSILPEGTDEAIAKRLQIILRRRGMAIQTGTTVAADREGRRDAPRVHCGSRRRGRLRGRASPDGDRSLAQHPGDGLRRRSACA